MGHIAQDGGPDAADTLALETVALSLMDAMQGSSTQVQPTS